MPRGTDQRLAKAIRTVYAQKGIPSDTILKVASIAQDFAVAVNVEAGWNYPLDQVKASLIRLRKSKKGGLPPLTDRKPRSARPTACPHCGGALTGG